MRHMRAIRAIAAFLLAVAMELRTVFWILAVAIWFTVERICIGAIDVLLGERGGKGENDDRQ